MIKAGIVIDNWKLPIFERHLSGAGYTFTQGKGTTEHVTLLTVNTEDVDALGEVVGAANAEAAKTSRGDK